ncbi:hypothetical protein N8I77_005733 [Diaporthe amygdali]|uniref:DUF7580 domain-containing protein n=1 Tax=Phomopsis amygdali TaxID=1214568 RepID=A0AAD9SGA1_PHOAM|nr:hypothetical protein N8I77_005733 [Diaporthe amygdali]
MAGIEVAGLVLGALPLLLKSVDVYRDGFRRFGSAFKKRKHVEKLGRALLLQHQTLEELIKSVALGSGCEDVWALEGDPVGYLNNPEVQAQVEEFLGPKHTMFLISELQANHEATKKVAKCISGLVPSYQGPTDDLVAIINANQGKPDLLADLAPRIKLVLGITDMKVMIQEIDEGTQTLHRFSSLAVSNCHAMGSNSSRKTLKLAKAFRQIQNLAGGLYEAVLDGFLDECHDNHEARLYLDDRIEIAQKVMHQRNKVKHNTPPISFELVFYADDQKRETLLYETPVQVLGEHSTDQTSNSPPAHLVTTAVTICIDEAPSEDDSRPEVAIITSICSAIREARGLKPRPSFALLNNRRMGTFRDDGTHPSPRSQIQGPQKDYISLGHILKGMTTALPLKPRMQLSLRLASSLLQLLHTQWIAQTWSKNMVFFLVPGKPTGLIRQAQVDLNRPFIACKFSGSADGQQNRSFLDPKSALLELGILLLEIWHGMTLEARFELDETWSISSSATYYKRLVMALEWQDDGENPMLGFYAQAVAHCLTGNAGAQDLSWEDTKLWAAICANVIEPLSKLCDDF